VVVLSQEFFSSVHSREFRRFARQVRRELGREPFELRSANYGVGANTFRALGVYGEAPSKVYQAWAKAVCDRLDPVELAKQISSRAGFERWHASLAVTLERRWRKAYPGRPLSVAHKYKLVDLFIKWLSRYDHGCTEFTNALVDHANCPLDSQALAKLNACLKHALPISSPRMGDIKTEQTYQFCQALVEGFAVSNGASKLLFDYYAWKSGRL